MNQQHGPSDSPQPPERVDVPPQPQTRRINSSDLLAGAQEVHIEHEGQTYRLRRTKAGKLILTK